MCLNARNKAIAPGFICEMGITMTPILQLPLEILFAKYLSSTCHVLNTQKKKINVTIITMIIILRADVWGTKIL